MDRRQTFRSLATLTCLSTALFGCGENKTGLSPGGGAHLRGAAQKGPFILGSSVTVSTLTASGSPNGQVFDTKTNSDAGDFDLAVPCSAQLSIEANGYYYNEIAGGLSGPLTLRSYQSLRGCGDVAGFVNVMTHLSYDRVRALVASGMAFPRAIATAEGELVTALGIGPTNFVFRSLASSVDLVGDDEQSAYLLALSTIVTQAASIRAKSGDGDAALQEMVSQIGRDLATDGRLDVALVNELERAETAVDPEQVMKNFAARLTSIGTRASVPNINRFIDTDLDGVPNSVDNCRLVSNPDQRPVTNGICFYRWVDNGYIASQRTYNHSIYFSAVADFNEDHKPDLAVCDVNQIYLSLGDGTGALRAGAPVSTYANSNRCQSVNAADFDGDGHQDLIFRNDQQQTVLALGDGHGLFPRQVVDLAARLWFPILAAADLNSDGLADLVVETQSQPPVVGVFINQGVGAGPSPTFDSLIPDAPDTYPVPDPGVWAGLYPAVVADLDGDRKVDLVLNGFATGVHVLLGAGDGTFTPGPAYAGQPNAFSADVGDTDGDGRLDVALWATDNASPGRSEKILVLPGNGRAAFGAALEVASTHDDFFSLLLGPFTRDALSDLVQVKFVVSPDDDDFSLIRDQCGLVFYPSLGRGRFGPPKFVVTGSLGAIAKADFNQDGKLDLAFGTDVLLMQ